MAMFKQFAAVMTLAAAPVQAEEAAIYRDVPSNPLTKCATEALKVSVPNAPEFMTVAKEVGGELTYEFQAGTNIEGLDNTSSLTIVIYPRETGIGSIELIASEKQLPDINAIAFGHMDKDRFEGSTEVSVASKGASAPQAEKIVLDRMTAAITSITRCMTLG